jgi:hypothetical protein
MRMLPHAVLTALLVVLPAVQEPSPAAQVIGSWRGTSICIKADWNRACHDEVIVYRFAAVGSRPDSVVLHAFKVLGDSLDWMGDLPLGYDRTSRLWQGDFANSRVHVRWSYAVEGQSLTGKVVDLSNGRKARDVVAKRMGSGP